MKTPLLAQFLPRNLAILDQLIKRGLGKLKVDGELVEGHYVVIVFSQHRIELIPVVAGFYQLMPVFASNALEPAPLSAGRRLNHLIYRAGNDCIATR